MKIGHDTFVDDLSSVNCKGSSDKTCEGLVRTNRRSFDIAGGFHVGRDEMDVGVGDQGTMFGYATDETEDCMPLTFSMATRLGNKLTEVRKKTYCGGCGPMARLKESKQWLFPRSMRSHWKPHGARKWLVTQVRIVPPGIVLTA